MKERAPILLQPESNGGIEPLCAIYSRNCLPLIKKQIERGELKTTEFYSRVVTKIIKLENLNQNSDQKNVFLKYKYTSRSIKRQKLF